MAIDTFFREYENIPKGKLIIYNGAYKRIGSAPILFKFATLICLKSLFYPEKVNGTNFNKNVHDCYNIIFKSNI
jgi:hypothetical protein